MEKTLELVEGAASKRPVGRAACGGGAAGTHGTAGDAPGRERAAAGTVLAVHARIEAAFRDGAFTRAVPNACRGNQPARPKTPMTRLLRRRRQLAPVPGGTPAQARPTAGTSPFTPRAGTEPGALTPRGQDASRQLPRRPAPHAPPRHHEPKALPPILLALGASQATLRAPSSTATGRPADAANS
jgi:hypothetical protein